MKVLLLPYNIASEISHIVKALTAIGVEAKGLSFGKSTIQTSNNIKTLPKYFENPVANRLNIIRNAAYLTKAVQWADVIHWTCFFNLLPYEFEKKIIRFFNKPGVIQWYGSDIRNPEIDFPINPYYKAAFSNGYEYQAESAKNSIQVQREFASVGFYPLELPDMSHYIDGDLFSVRFKTSQMVVLDEYTPKYPDSNNQKPLIVHAPSAPVTKGTEFVLRAVENLKHKYDFDFTLVQGMERSKALEIMSKCDIYIDQLILGAYGYASVEAMAFGKPVVCYINEIIGENYPEDLPIVNANPDSITECLERLIKDSILRRELGGESRSFAEKYHNDKDISKKLVETYREVIRLHKEKNKKD